ncbi:hypothetical protein M231_06849 [Tremella mesenterica]|uniref:Rho-GAP domain-containing protein n=1 Tax=Tremella mesenterica TaxID=5217 RepID=A0A4Q1BEV0_TREME|nr:hypothetical protein M231_06849 [Tremella mesenterica]
METTIQDGSPSIRDLNDKSERERPPRPLSEISDNDNRRSIVSITRESKRSSRHLELEKDKGRSRPSSDVKDENTPPTTSTPNSPSLNQVVTGGQMKMLTINLIDYASQQRRNEITGSPIPTPIPSPLSTNMTTGILESDETVLSDMGDSGHEDLKNKSVTKETNTKINRTVTYAEASKSVWDKHTDNSIPTSPKHQETQFAGIAEDKKRILIEDKKLPKTPEPEETKSRPVSIDGVSALYIAKRASLRPSPLGPSYADIVRPNISLPLTADDRASLDSRRSSVDLLKPPTKNKPSWLRRASNTAAAGLRAKSRSPVAKEETTLASSSSLPNPPALPPRHNQSQEGEMMEASSSISSISDKAIPMPPPELPKKSTYAKVVSTRSRLAEGVGKPAFLPPPPSHPSRENIGNIRGRIAAWTSAAGSNNSFSRSASSATLSPPPPSSFIPAGGSSRSQAQKVLGHAGSAVQKGWAGIRRSGVAGSISSLSQLGGSNRRSPSGSVETGSSWSSGLGKKGKEKIPLVEEEPRGDGPHFEVGVVKRAGKGREGLVFGRDLIETGRTFGVVDAMSTEEGGSELDRRRRQCLPAIVVRAVDYLEIWGPKEEGIFRISGRSSHIAKLRKEFDSGADLDITPCHPGDVDPHAVAGVFKLYLRQLPHHLLTDELSDQFETYDKSVEKDPAELDRLLQCLPSAHWFLLADIIKLLDLIPRHVNINRMTLHALRTSLGPSLNLPGNLADELVIRREELFSHPPPITTVESASNLINFSEVSIPPPSVPKDPHHRPITPLSGEENVHHVRLKRSSPRLPKRPSIQRLFSSGAGFVTRKGSVETMHSASVIGDLPPQVDIPISNATPMSTLDGHVQSAPHRNDEWVEEKMEELQHLTENPTTSARSRAFSETSTPIADKFQGTSPIFPPLRIPRSSATSVESSASIPTLGSLDGQSSNHHGPAMIRRGQPVFFQSQGLTHHRSKSANGMKRKDEPEEGEEETEGGRGGKRLSSGLKFDGVNVRDAVRAMEMTA